MRFAITTAFGGPDAGTALRATLLALKNELRDMAANLNASDIDVFEVRLAVSGSISTFPEDGGLHKLVITPSARRARAYITVQAPIWKSGVDVFRRFFLDATVDAIQELDRQSKKKGLDTCASALLALVIALRGPLQEGTPTSGAASTMQHAKASASKRQSAQKRARRS